MLHIGLDLHKHFSRLAVMNDAGEIVERQTLRHDDRAALVDYFRKLAGKAIVTLEATRNWYWLYELLEELGVDVRLAHPRKVRLIAEAKIKTDNIDSGGLAQLERTGFLPEAYIPTRPVRDSRELMRYRLALVHFRTGMKNRIHGLLDKLGVMHSYTDLFGAAGRRFLETVELRAVYRKALDGYLILLDHVEERIVAATRDIKAAIQPDPRAELLMTIPGVAHLTAHLLLAEIGDISRFKSAKKLCAYGGIVPMTRQSANHCYQGRITREGSRYIRWAMIEAAQKAPSKDPALMSCYRKLAPKRGPSKARVAVARRLLTAVWYVLTLAEPYRFGRVTNCS
jgi:transposase